MKRERLEEVVSTEQLRGGGTGGTREIREAHFAARVPRRQQGTRRIELQRVYLLLGFQAPKRATRYTLDRPHPDLARAACGGQEPPGWIHGERRRALMSPDEQRRHVSEPVEWTPID